MADFPNGVGRIVLPEIDSTNDEVRRRANAGEKGPLWIRADRQVRGRGRQGRPWREAEGNLYASLLLRPSVDAATAALFSFVAAVAVAELFESVGGEVDLKWPNDALLNGGKASGVLLEASGDGQRVDWLAIGVGVNLVSHPSDVTDAIHPPTDLAAATGRRVTPDEALASIAGSVARWGARLENEGFSPIRDAWLARARRIGQKISVRAGERSVDGVFEDIDAAGALIVRAQSGVFTFHAADVHFR